VFNKSKKQMKKFFLVVVSLIVFNLASQSQGFSIYGLGGYTFDDEVSLDGWPGKVVGGFSWMAGAEFMRNKYQGFELYYSRQATTGYVNYLNRKYEADIGVNYIMAGGIGSIPTKSIFTPYGGISLGYGWVYNQEIEDDRGGFAWGLKGGVKAQLGERVNLRVLAHLHSITQAFGGGFYFGTGGTGAGVSTYSTMYQFGFSGGLGVNLGGGRAKSSVVAPR
jgi:Outer membrane protein beta-barrel domain